MTPTGFHTTVIALNTVEIRQVKCYTNVNASKMERSALNECEVIQTGTMIASERPFLQ